MRGITERRRARGRRFGSFAFALSCTCAAVDPPPAADVVRLSIPDCDGASGAQITELVGLELAAHSTIVQDDTQPATLRASLHCDDSHAIITVEDSRRPTPLVLRLDLDETRTEARPRFLALAVAELIATSRLERAPPPAPPPPRAPAPVRARLVPPVHAHEPTSSFWLSAGVLRSHDPAVWSPALVAGAAHGFGRLALTGDVEFDWGQRTTAAATVDVRSLSLSLAPALSLATGRFGWQLGLGVRAGEVWLEATPREANLVGKSLSGIFIAPILQSAQHLRLAGPVFARLALEAGYVVKTVRGLDADRSPLLEVRGLRVSALLGVGLSL